MKCMPQRLHIRINFFTYLVAVNTFVGRAKGNPVILKLRMQFSPSAKLLTQFLYRRYEDRQCFQSTSNFSKYVYFWSVE